MSASQNYEVTCTAVGRYPRGSVIPDYVVRQAGDPAAFVADGFIKPTNNPVNVEVWVPPAVDDTATDLHAANKDLTADKAKLQLAVESRDHLLETANQKVDSLTRELSLKVTEIDRLNALLAEKDAELKAANELLAEKK
jgi:hypothetical protein